MDNKQLALVIVEKAGGKDNIADLANCMTRMRMHVKHPEQISKTELEAIEGVLGVILEEDYLQVVLGPGKAKKVTDEALAQLGLGADSDWKANKEAVKSKQKKSKVKDFLAMISGIFVPLIPAIIAAGLFNGFASRV